MALAIEGLLVGCGRIRHGTTEVTWVEIYIFVQVLMGGAIEAKIGIVVDFEVTCLLLRVLLVEFKVDLLPDVDAIVLVHLVELPVTWCINRCI